MKLTIGTRGSTLALRQAGYISQLLSAHDPSVRVELRTVQTLGDRNQRDRISEIGDKGVFVRTIEELLRSREIDIAVHSLKDVPSDVEPPDLIISAFSEREDPRDALVSLSGEGLARLPHGARVGTSSLRRRAQLLHLRPDLQVLDIRGNVDTRLRKLAEGQFDAIILAAAGLRRLNLSERIAEYFPIERFVPDAGQGIIAVQTRAGGDAASIVAGIDTPGSRLAAEAERAVVQALGADCHSPVGAHVDRPVEGGTIFGMAASEDCTQVVYRQVPFPITDPAGAGRYLGGLLAGALDHPSLY